MKDEYKEEAEYEFASRKRELEKQLTSAKCALYDLDGFPKVMQCTIEPIKVLFYYPQVGVVVERTEPFDPDFRTNHGQRQANIGHFSEGWEMMYFKEESDEGI